MATLFPHHHQCDSRPRTKSHGRVINCNKRHARIYYSLRVVAFSQPITRMFGGVMTCFCPRSVPILAQKWWQERGGTVSINSRSACSAGDSLPADTQHASSRHLPVILTRHANRLLRRKRKLRTNVCWTRSKSV